MASRRSYRRLANNHVRYRPYPFFGAGGTFFPALRASDNPIAIACFGLVTFFPLRPLFSVPFFISLISVSTFLLADGLYFRAELLFFAAFFAGAFFVEVFFAADFFVAFFVVIGTLHPLRLPNRNSSCITNDATHPPIVCADSSSSNVA
jgi:hypothetical protein